jgi:hypothetical protein
VVARFDYPAGNVMADRTIPRLDAPLDLEPKTAMVWLGQPLLHPVAGITVRIDPEHRVQEIAKANNAGSCTKELRISGKAVTCPSPRHCPRGVQCRHPRCPGVRGGDDPRTDHSDSRGDAAALKFELDEHLTWPRLAPKGGFKDRNRLKRTGPG